MAEKLPASFYLRDVVLAIARDLPGFSLYMFDCKQSPDEKIFTSAPIGADIAGEDALLPCRFSYGEILM